MDSKGLKTPSKVSISGQPVDPRPTGEIQQRGDLGHPRRRGIVRHLGARRGQRDSRHAEMGRRAADETRILEPGEKFPDLEKLNANTPQSEWREGPDGKLHGPWQNSIPRLSARPGHAERFTYAASTIGGGIAVRDLVDRTRWMRKFRGEQCLRRCDSLRHVYEHAVRRAPAAALRD